MPSKPADVIAALRAEGFDAQPHNLGLARYAPDPAAYARALRQCQPTALRIVTMPASGDQHPMQPPPCTRDGMICDCLQHAQERLRLVRRGPVGEGPAAFGVRPTRRAA